MHLARRMVVAGAGPVGLELAQAFQKRGSQVTLIEGGPRMLPNHEEFARVSLTTALRQDGVEVLTTRPVVRLGRNGDAYLVTTSDDGTAEAGSRDGYRGLRRARRRRVFTKLTIRSRNALEEALTTESSPAPAR